MKQLAIALLLGIVATTAAAEVKPPPEPFGYAPRGAFHDDRVRYRLPFELHIPRFLSQGVGGPFTHQGFSHYAFDFGMPEGTPVLAARGGTVAFVIDGIAGKDDVQLGGNRVDVLHEDGTFALYAHLSPGLAVRKGQRVEAGDLLGRSGNTGGSPAPHLHFSVQRISASGQYESVPIRFGTGSRRGFVPEQNRFYGSAPRQSGTLRVTAGGEAIDEARPLLLARGASLPLTATFRFKGLPAEDVTRDDHVRFYSATAWAVVVDDQGVVTAAASPDYAVALARYHEEHPEKPRFDTHGVLVVSYEDEARGRLGFAAVPVVIEDAAPR